MKKTILTLTILFAFVTPSYAIDIPYVTYMPYKQYKKRIKLTKIVSSNTEQIIYL